MNPVNSNSRLVAQYELTRYQETLKGVGRAVLAKKAKRKDGTFLCSFCDMEISADESIDYLNTLEQNGQDFSMDDFKQKSERFGMQILRSDKDMTCLEAYNVFDSRHVIELAFRYYKSSVTASKAEFQNVFSVIGAEFANFIATLLSCRIIERARKAGLLIDMSYGDLIDDLDASWRLAAAPNEKPKYSDKYWAHASLGARNLLASLDLIESAPVAEKTTNDRKNQESKNKEGDTDAAVVHGQNPSISQESKRWREFRGN
ncbi:MAG: hypothetical protein IJ523_05255 [Succinivibrionaceae bacterium]|nr:hypothetical protein [Succinivibrionaceae bacterium]